MVVRDGTAGLLWGSACNYIAESECMEGAGWDHLNYTSLQYRSALVVARMGNIQDCDSIGLWDDRMTNVQASTY